ncbi:hypothetical protein POF51_26020 [Brevibacillus sp. AG]|uniref:hypothetical protein n=1 Tax=Brevibacillus sp. AG TaxID=3020891 RepID=UPI00232FA084|nr:hypothetical protein [Brevibacillus sp. AG]MDC0764181.1 hypothetical protein [Brevibacillus sp. AG]
MSFDQFKLTPEKTAEFRGFQRQRTLLTGVITHHKHSSKQVNGETLTYEAVEVQFPDGTIGICEVNDFDEYKFESLIGFVGYEEPFLVERVDERNSVILLNRIKALEILKENLWNTIRTEQIVQANFRSMNVETGKIHFNVFGQNVWMNKEDWDHSYIPQRAQDINLQAGDEIELQVVRIWTEEKIIQVSRKSMFPDPWIGITDRMKVGEHYAGEVVNVSLYENDKWQGYFVKIQNQNIVLRCTPRHGLVPPATGDTVNIRLDFINETERKGRGSIVKVINRKENAFNETSKYNKFVTISRREARKQQEQLADNE